MAAERNCSETEAPSRRSPDARAFRQAIQAIPQFGVRILTVSSDLIDAAAAVSQQTGLLANDGLIVAVMQAQKLAHLARVDSDFDRVSGLTRYAPP